MSKLQTEYGPKGLQVIDVAINANADLGVEDFAKEQQTTFPVGWAVQNAHAGIHGIRQQQVCGSAACAH